VSEAANEAVIERFYHGLWNRWDLTVADEIISGGVRFRGSLGSTLEGRENFKGYVETVRAAFPDWHDRIDEMISCGNRVVTRMTWSGTHRGRLQEAGCKIWSPPESGSNTSERPSFVWRVEG